MDNKAKINQKRRDILKTFAASGISKSIISASPFVTGMLMARHADASNNKINRSVAIYIPGGCVHEHWAPSGSGNKMKMGKMSKGYESVKTDCHFLTGMSAPGNAGHGGESRVFSRGNWNDDSFDVIMGRELGQGMPFKYLNLGVHSNDGGHGKLTKDNTTTVPYQDNPFAAFKLLFGSGNANPGNSQRPFSKILDLHSDAAKSIKKKLGSYEVHRMDEHLDSIADTRKRLEAMGGGSGGGSSCGAAPDGSEFALTYDTFTQQAKLQADIIAAALKCNFTASCSLSFSNSQCDMRVPELKYKGTYHQTMHSPSPGFPEFIEVRSHLASLVAYLIENLKSEGILEDTLIVEASDHGNGSTHNMDNAPMMFAGGSNAIRNGVVTSGAGYMQHDLMHTAAKAAGVTLPFGKEIPGVIKS